ncbi:hypothetical protein [Haloarchaeobius sp. FL176]|uniref:hypothetical protein n=1 Tax=Haloarchaeobius sp. FL176 TaxID=2967129 RepID=UPI002148CA4E|nr:hypothetical protein [Haloarchaeobius sp. FL176]
MSEFDTLADLFPPDRQPTRELEPIQKVDKTDQIEKDIDEFYETESAKRVLRETAAIVANEGVDHRFRYVHATFGSGKSHLLKLIGVATGEIEGLESSAHDLANTTTGFKEFRDAITDSHIDHLQPLFLNLLDRDRDDTKLPLILYEELGRRRGYHTDLPWLLEFCWQLDIEHDLWEQLSTFEHEELQLTDVVDRPASLRPWLQQAIPQLGGAAAAGLDSAAAVDDLIEAAETAIDPTAFGPDDLVERLHRTKRHLEQDGDTYEFLIGLDEIAIYVGDQQRRYEEVVDTITALIEGLNPPILGTGQWPMRDMQQRFFGDADDEAWYAQEVKLEGADTETIVRKRWLQKSEDGADYIQSDLLEDATALDPTLHDEASPPEHNDPVEAYPFRDLDLWLLRDSMQGLIEGERNTDREYIQGRALLARVRSLFVNHGWASRTPGVVVPWNELFDIIDADTELISGWASDLISRVANTFDAETAQTAKALFLLSQVETVPRTADNLARLLVDDVGTDIQVQRDTVESHLEAMVEKNLIRKSTETAEPTYTILSEGEIQFWQQVQQEATELPEHQVQNNIREFIREADPTRLPSHEGTKMGTFGDLDGINYTVRYAIDRSIPDSVTEEYDTIVIRVLVHDEETISDQRTQWQEAHSGPAGREDVLVTVNITETTREQIRELIGMQQVLSGMADPSPDHRLRQQSMQEEIEDDLRGRLNEAAVYLPQREASYGTYLQDLDTAVTDAVIEKFPSRKNIDHTLQVEDLEALIDFFQDGGAWPLSDDDADRLGVNKLPGTISDGWAMEFLELDRFDGDERVSGARILGTINSRGGEFLGTPLEALQTLLFVLVADNRIAIRSDGDRVTDTRTIASTITSITQFEDAIVVFDPSPPPEDLNDVYAALVGEEPETDDTQELLEGIEAWATKHAEEFNTVVSQVDLKFNTQLSLATLNDALKPAFSGEELDANLLTNEQVVDQAHRYADAAPLFIPASDDEEPLWDQITAVDEWLKDHYPTAAITGKVSTTTQGYQIPRVDTLESQLTEAQKFRVETLQELSQDLTGEPTTTDDLETLRAELTVSLQSAALTSDIERVVETYPKVQLDTLQATIDDANDADEPLAEEAFAEKAMRTDADTLANGRTLLRPITDGESLYEQLRQLSTKLPDSPSGFVAQQITKAVSGATIPDPDRAAQLLKQGRAILEGDNGGGKKKDDDGLWQQLSTYDDGTIVVIDTEDDQ